MVVVAVDGINVVTGRNASPSQQGYVLAPYQEISIDGWRKSFTQVAQFNFTSVANSYAGQTGRWNQVGVIGAAVFAEALPQPMPMIYPRQENMPATKAAAPSAAGAAQDSAARSIGTGHGDAQWSPVVSTQFTRASTQPDEILRLDYDQRENLVRRGIIPDAYEGDDEPEAFPGGFVPDP
jgi:hypothetical protein